MGRKTSPIEDFIEIASLMPWKFCLASAVLSYFILHYFSVMEIPKTVDIGHIQPFLGRSMGKTLAMFGQYIMPFAFSMAGLLSFVRVHKREKLMTKVQCGRGPDILQDMTWHEFETLVGEAFRRKGYSVKENYEKGPDGGVDLVLLDGSEKYLVQCKQWRALKVGVKVVRELYGVMASTGAVGGFVVTSGEFTRDSKDFAQGTNIELIDGTELKCLIRDVKSSLSAAVTIQAVTQGKQCPNCGKEMILRTARRGAQAGQQFWGCKGYPECKTIFALGYEN
ncbi:MAG: restriction endonuclease [Desulfocapsaceae bacterium]|nr:restriction endonuclease [Desulfocapsaceae bacterium]